MHSVFTFQEGLNKYELDLLYNLMPCFFPFSSPGLENDNGYRTQELDYWIAPVISFHFFLRNRCMTFQSKHKRTNLFRILFYIKDSQVPFKYPHFLTCYYSDVKCWAWHVLLIPKLFLRNTPFCSIRAHTEVLKALWKARSKEFIILLCAHT